MDQATDAWWHDHGTSRTRRRPRVCAALCLAGRDTGQPTTRRCAWCARLTLQAVNGH